MQAKQSKFSTNVKQQDTLKKNANVVFVLGLKLYGAFSNLQTLWVHCVYCVHSSVQFFELQDNLFLGLGWNSIAIMNIFV